MKTFRNLSILAVLAVLATVPFLTASAQGPEGPGPRGWEGFAERHDVNGDGQVTRDELAQTIDMFDELDADGDGTLSAADFEARRGDMAFGIAAHHADANRDRQVTAREWDSFFAEHDTNGDGRLTPDDREDGAEWGRRGRGPRAERFGEALDADGDGDVTRSDFTILAAQYDTNGDGVLTEAELPDMYHGRHHGGMGMRGHH